MQPRPLLALAYMQTCATASIISILSCLRRGMPVAAPTMPQAHTMNARRLGAPTRRMSRFAGSCASGQLMVGTISYL